MKHIIFPVLSIVIIIVIIKYIKECLTTPWEPNLLAIPQWDNMLARGARYRGSNHGVRNKVCISIKGSRKTEE